MDFQPRIFEVIRTLYACRWRAIRRAVGDISSRGVVCSDRGEPIWHSMTAMLLLGHVDDRLLDFRQAPTVAIVEQETALGTAGVLTEVALGTPGRFAAFDDVVTLTVRAADGDERHGPFLPQGDYEDEAQCDINRSLSPLLKHYPLLLPHQGGANASGVCPLESAVSTSATLPCALPLPATRYSAGWRVCQSVPPW